VSQYAQLFFGLAQLVVVSAMLLYERIKLSSKSLYLTAIKKEIYKYEDVYHQAAHDRLVDKLLPFLIFTKYLVNAFSIIILR
jgi:hypothetical protein